MQTWGLWKCWCIRKQRTAQHFPEISWLHKGDNPTVRHKTANVLWMETVFTFSFPLIDFIYIFLNNHNKFRTHKLILEAGKSTDSVTDLWGTAAWSFTEEKRNNKTEELSLKGQTAAWRSRRTLRWCFDDTLEARGPPSRECFYNDADSEGVPNKDVI